MMTNLNLFDDVKHGLFCEKKKNAIRGGCGACSHLLPQNLNEFLLKAC